MECPKTLTQDSSQAKYSAKKDFESLAMIIGESACEYVARVKGLASVVKYHGVEVTNEEICRRILKGLPPALHFVREALRI